MKYKNFRAKKDDGFWLFNQIRNKLVNKVIINNLVCNEGIVNGRYLLKGYDNGIDFHISYSKEEFIRVSVGTSCTWAKYEDKVFVLNEIKNVISATIRDGVLLGEPTVFYNISQGIYKTPNLEYIYDDKENYIKSFQDKTIFGGIIIPEDVIVFDNNKKSRTMLIEKCYSYNKNYNGKKYSIIIEGVYENSTNIDNDKLRPLIEENFDYLFTTNHKKLCYILDKYLSSYGDFSYVVGCIREASSYAKEVGLVVTIKEDDSIIDMVHYDDGILRNYSCKCNVGKCILYTEYDLTNGISFKTSCDVKNSDVITVAEYSLNQISKLKDCAKSRNVENNTNLLKLVKRMGNK